MNRLNEIEARANAATEGPWEWEGEAKAEWEIGANSLVPSRRPDDPVLYGYGYDASGIEVKTPADAEFIAHARTDMPDMAAALRAVLAVHSPDYTYPECPKCSECSDIASTETRKFVVLWPCPTVETIRRHLGDDL